MDTDAVPIYKFLQLIFKVEHVWQSKYKVSIPYQLTIITSLNVQDTVSIINTLRPKIFNKTVDISEF